MNWDDMRIFLSVAREESLSGAAKALRLDPATVGRRIARLEREMEAILFVKSPQGYVLTDAGTRLMAHATTAETAMSGAVSETRGAKEELTGTIRVTLAVRPRRRGPRPVGALDGPGTTGPPR